MIVEDAETPTQAWPSHHRWTRAAPAALAMMAALPLAAALFARPMLEEWVAGGWPLVALAALPLVSVVATGLAMARARQEALRRSAWFESQARRNRLLLRTASDGLHVLDRSGRLVKFSDSFATALERSREDLAGAHVTTWDARYAPDVMADWFATFQPGERRSFESVHRRASGAFFDVEVSCSMVRVDHQDLIYCSARDVTERHRLERELADSAAQIRSLYDGAPCAYHSLDEQGRYVYVNDTELGWLGFRREELVGQLGPRDFLAGESVAVFQQNFPRLLRGEAVDNVEVDLIARDGHRRRVSVSATPMLDAQGNFRMSRTVMHDVTELHRTRKHLQRVMREQSAMLDNDLVGMIRMRERRIVWANPAMCRLFGHAPGGLEGEAVRALFADADRFEALARDARAALAAGERFRAECELVRKDGVRRWFEINGVMLSALRNESMWLFADITARRLAFEQVSFLAFHDDLTGLPNRALLMDRLQQELNAALRSGTLVAVCYIDLDGFKAINDRHGHAAGDAMLKEVGRRLRECTRNVDTVSRLGGDEFVVVLSELGDMERCREILRRIEASMHCTIGLGEVGDIALSASIGVAIFPQHGHGPGELLARADGAMYVAKRRGDGRAVLHADATSGQAARASGYLP